MSIAVFNNPELTDENGILLLGGELNQTFLTAAYENGVFPWPISGLPLAWFCPPQRALLFFEDLHISKSLDKFYRKNHFTFTLNKDFPAVIQACAASKRPLQSGTWITQKMITAYTQLHFAGLCHSLEVWDKNNALVGGLYGVCMKGCFAAESMFYTVPGASKCAIIYLSKYLKNRGCSWMDIQVMTPHMEKFGAIEVDRSFFLNLLKDTQKQELLLF